VFRRPAGHLQEWQRSLRHPVLQLLALQPLPALLIQLPVHPQPLEQLILPPLEAVEASTWLSLAIR
jgi:hypothetical protein